MIAKSASNVRAVSAYVRLARSICLDWICKSMQKSANVAVSARAPAPSGL